MIHLNCLLICLYRNEPKPSSSNQTDNIPSKSQKTQHTAGIRLSEKGRATKLRTDKLPPHNSDKAHKKVTAAKQKKRSDRYSRTRSKDIEADEEYPTCTNQTLPKRTEISSITLTNYYRRKNHYTENHILHITDSLN